MGHIGAGAIARRYSMVERSMETRSTTSETKTVADNNEKRESGAMREARVDEDWGLGFEGGARSQGHRCLSEHCCGCISPMNLVLFASPSLAGLDCGVSYRLSCYGVSCQGCTHTKTN
jgi:hypothetical protein